MSQPFYITTAIDYANGDPHLGHAIEKIGADAIARYHRLRGDDVHFLIGMDEHGQKVAQAAAAEGLSPQALTDRVADVFSGHVGAASHLQRSIHPHDGARASRGRARAHRADLRAIARRLLSEDLRGVVLRWVRGVQDRGEIEDGRCVLHPTRTLEWVEERNWFFRLSHYTRFPPRALRRAPGLPGSGESPQRDPGAVRPEGSRTFRPAERGSAWGIPFPRPTADGEPQTTYVWFDALPNYLTATGFPDADFARRWPAQLHVIGKDITRFHCVIWPAMLQAADLPLPERVWAHGFVTLAGGERFSKSAGVRVELAEAIERHGPDAFRYFMLREIPFDADGAFSWERFDERYTADLANAFGNLLSRTVAMVERYCAGTVPPGRPNEVDAADSADYERYRQAMDGGRGYLLHEALRHVWLTVARGNEYVDRQAPWKLAKDPAQRRGARRSAGHARSPVSAPGDPPRAVHARPRRGGLAPARRARARFTTSALASRRRRSIPRGGRSSRGDPLFPKVETAGSGVGTRGPGT